MDPTLEQWASAGYDVICALVGQAYGPAVGSDPAQQAEVVASTQARWDALKGAFVLPGGVVAAVDGELAGYVALVDDEVAWADLCVSDPAAAEALYPGRAIVDQSYLDAMLALQTALANRPDTATTLGI